MFKKIISLFLSSSFLCASTGQIAKVNSIDIWYETFGNKENPALLLIMGGCCSGVMWHDSFCEKLSNEGFYVIRYDHRDTGLSSSIDFEKNPYTLIDLTQDAVGVLDAEKIHKAHLFGLSMGSFIAECMAAHYPKRVLTITLMSSSPDIHPMNLAYAGLPSEKASSLPPPTPEYLAWMNEWTRLTPQTHEELLAQRIEGWDKLNGSKIPLDDPLNREIHQKFLSRFNYPQGILNHIKMLRDERTEELVRTAPAKIKVPTTIIQGSEDPIYPPDHGKALHHLILHSNYLLIEGMGHVPNNHFFDLYITLLKQQAKAP